MQQLPTPLARLRRLLAPLGAPAALLWLLLANTLAVAALTAIALRAELAQTAAERRAASEHALAALAAQVERVVYREVQEPALLARSLGPEDLGEDILRQVRARQPGVVDVLLLSPDFRVLRNWPVLPSEETRFVSAALAQRVLGEARSGHVATLGLQGFSDGASEPPILYVYLPADDMPAIDDAPAAWWVLGFDSSQLLDGPVGQMLERFRRERGVDAVISAPDREVYAAPVGLDLGGVLGGWRMELLSTPDGDAVAWRAELSWIALAVVLALGVALVSAAIVRAIRRERALVALRNRFVASVSHELKTPLSLIRMYAETLLLGRLVEPGRVQDYHRVILRESERLSRMIEDVLLFASLRRGESARLRMDAQDLEETVLTVAQTYAPEWRARGAQLSVDVAADVPPCRHDAQAIQQVLINLVDNAIAYAGPSPRVALRLEVREGGAVLEVEDSGPGMPDDLRERAMHSLARGVPFAEAQGTGLGLALVARIARAHGAMLELARAAEGAGLCVRVCFAALREDR